MHSRLSLDSLFELLQQTLIRRPQHVVDLGHLVQLVGSREERVQAGTHTLGHTCPAGGHTGDRQTRLLTSGSQRRRSRRSRRPSSGCSSRRSGGTPAPGTNAWRCTQCAAAWSTHCDTSRSRPASKRFAATQKEISDMFPEI